MPKPDTAALTLPPPAAGPRGADARMDRALARQTDVAPHGIDWQEIHRVCRAALEARILPQSIQNESQAVAIALKARELGVPPMQGFSAIHLIQGVATCSASLMLGLAYRRLPEFSVRVVERSPTKCVMEFRRDRNREWLRITYTIEEATKAGLTGKTNWKNHPAAMLTARATGIGCRLVAPDVFAGLYATEEIDGGIPPEAGPVEERDIGAADVVAPPDASAGAAVETTVEPVALATDAQRADLKALLGSLERATIERNLLPTDAPSPTSALLRWLHHAHAVDLRPVFAAQKAGTLTEAAASGTIADLRSVLDRVTAPAPAGMSAEDQKKFDDEIPF